MISCGGVRKQMTTAMHCGLPGRRSRATCNYSKRAKFEELQNVYVAFRRGTLKSLIVD